MMTCNSKRISLTAALLLVFFAGAGRAYDGPLVTPQPKINNASGPINVGSMTGTVATTVNLTWNIRSWADANFPPTVLRRPCVHLQGMPPRPQHLQGDVYQTIPNFNDPDGVFYAVMFGSENGEIVDQGLLPLDGGRVLDLAGAGYRGRGTYFVKIVARRGNSDVARKSDAVRINAPNNGRVLVRIVSVDPVSPTSGQGFAIRFELYNLTPNSLRIPYKISVPSTPYWIRTGVENVGASGSAPFRIFYPGTPALSSGQVARVVVQADPENALNENDHDQPDNVAYRDVTIAGGTQLEWSWNARLTPAHFTTPEPAGLGVTLTADQTNKLNNTTYTIGSIIGSGTDRLFDANNSSSPGTCLGCHSGAAGQVAGRYRPTIPIQPNTEHRVQKADAATTSAYRWNNNDNAGVVFHFRNASITKPEALKKLFQKWLEGGAR